MVYKLNLFTSKLPAKIAIGWLFIFLVTLLAPFSAGAATLLSDDFTGTTIDTNKWTEIDTGGAGGTSGNVQQNGSLTIANSYNGSTWGQNVLVSADNFDSDTLEISAVMTRASDQLLGYGDYNFQSAGTKAYILDLVSGTPLVLVWNNGSLSSNANCGSYTAGATYKMTIISGGFEIYKNGTLACSHSTAIAIDDEKVFLQSSGSASTFDDVLVTGIGGAATVPDAPTGLSATPASTQVALSWTAPASNGGSAITDYLVEYKLSADGSWSTFSDGTSTATTATVTGLTNSSSYDFRVSATNAIGTSTPSSTATATPTAPTAPAAPTIGTAIAGNASASVSFTPGSNGGSAITGYTVTSSPGGITGTGSSSPITVSGLTNGTAYTFTVTATNAIGTSSASSASNSVTPNQEVPSSIANLALWLDGADSANMTESGGLISQINDKSGNDKNGTASGNVRPSLISNALNGRSVMRFDGTEDYFNINSSITYRTMVVVAKYNSTSFSNYPGIIGDFTGSSPSNGHILNGIDGTNKLGQATSNYTSAYRNGDSIAGSGGHSFAPLNEYWIGTFQLSSSITNTTSAIGMINGGGRYWNGDIAEVIVYSSTITTNERQTLENYLSTKWGIAVSGPSVPGAPTSLGAAKGSTQISLSWTAPASDGGSAITDYLVEYKLSSDSTWSTFSDGTSTATTATVTGLTNDLSYDFRVKAVNAMGTSSASSTATKTPGAPVAPDAPTGVSAATGNTQAVISFTAPVDNGGSAITGYTVTSSPGGITGTGSSSPITVSGLTNGTAYTFTVTATNAIGTSSASSASNSVTPSTLGNQLTDNFTGTTINTDKWYEYDPTGAGGTTGKIQQNGSLTIADSFSGSWGQNALISQDTFSSTSLEISASMVSGSGALIGYGDYNFGISGTKAYLVYISGAGASGILALSWNAATMEQTSCGTADAGAATYKMKIISGGFEVYKNGALLCTHNTAVAIDDKPVFLENSAAASTFDDVVVYGEAPVDTVPGAPTIGTATAGNGSASITFTAPASNGGSAITGYTVTSSPGGITGTGSSSPITVSGLTNGTAYTFTVTATNAIGTSSASSASNSVTPSLPEAPGQVTGLVATGLNQQVLLGWDAPATGGAPTDYIIEYKLSSDSSWSTFSDGTSTSKKATVTGLTNGSTYDFRVTGSNDGNPGTASSTVSATAKAISNLSFVITGESNSGGIGLNSDATVGELASRSAVQILELTSGNFLFENLDIGTNNLRDHAGLSGYYDCCHGLELQLANSTEANAFPDNPQVYLIKTGQGGSRVSEWAVGQSYWTKFLQRTAAAKTQIPEDRQWVVWLSLGINDAISATNVNTFKSGMVEWIDRIKADLPGSIIVMTQFQSMGYASYNTALAEVADAEPNVYVVNSTGAALRDSNHWSYAGFKTLGASMVTTTKNVLGLNYPGLPTSLSATPASSSVALSWTAPVANGGAAITDYVIQYKTSAATSWSTFSDGASTSTSTTVTGLSGSTDYNFRVKAVNSSGGGNFTTVNATTTDGSAPVVSSVSATTTNTSFTVTWTTDENASTIIDYGITNSYGSSTSETDTSPRVTSHSATVSSLLPCTTYHYRVRSRDASLNAGTSSNATVTTTGCTGNSSVTSSTTGLTTNAAGGSHELKDGDDGMTLTVPAGAVGADAVFQLKQLDTTDVQTAINKPSGLNLVSGYTYQLNAVSGVSTAVTTFITPLTISISYDDADIAGMNESALVIYHYSSGAWSPLSNCTVNTTTNVVTCETSSFSVFALAGSSSSSNSSSSGSKSKTTTPTVSAHSVGTNIVTSDGTIYTLTSDGKRKPYTSAGAFLSYGFNSFASVVQANTADLVIPVGEFIAPRDGSIICSDRGEDKGTCYLITQGKKAGFTSSTVFIGLGFSFDNSQPGDVSFMDSVAHIASSEQAHSYGTLINNKGTIQIVGNNILIGIPSMEVLVSWGYDPSTAVIANSYDKQITQGQVLSTRAAGVMSF